MNGKYFAVTRHWAHPARAPVCADGLARDWYGCNESRPATAEADCDNGMRQQGNCRCVL